MIVPSAPRLSSSVSQVPPAMGYSAAPHEVPSGATTSTRWVQGTPFAPSGKAAYAFPPPAICSLTSRRDIIQSGGGSTFALPLRRTTNARACDGPSIRRTRRPPPIRAVVSNQVEAPGEKPVKRTNSPVSAPPSLSNHCAEIVPPPNLDPPSVITSERPRRSTPSPNTVPDEASVFGPQRTDAGVPPPPYMSAAWSVGSDGPMARSPANSTPPFGSAAAGRVHCPEWLARWLAPVLFPSESKSEII